MTIDPTSVPAASQAVVELTSGYRAAATGVGRKGITAVRMIGEMGLRPVSSTGDVDFAAGITLVGREEGGSSVFPDPKLDADEPWMWFQGGVMVNDVIRYTNYPINVKSQRLFREPFDRLYFIIDNDHATIDLVLALAVRILFLLP